jgi:hypothetical protein
MQAPSVSGDGADCSRITADPAVPRSETTARLLGAEQGRQWVETEDQFESVVCWWNSTW